ncbi:MAG: type II toxin-antitoxin system CcdA family antitoxin [Desulfuromonadales bacterium]|nr:type II toxin-antitoxin system CcdA family antitoxin [Desulfuromonadales bacterium]
MHLTKTSITLPDDLLQEARSISKNVSALIADALREYLHQRKIQKALESFGAWKEREGDSTDTVNSLRKEEDRDYAGRAH